MNQLEVVSINIDMGNAVSCDTFAMMPLCACMTSQGVTTQCYPCLDQWTVSSNEGLKFEMNEKSI